MKRRNKRTLPADDWNIWKNLIQSNCSFRFDRNVALTDEARERNENTVNVVYVSAVLSNRWRRNSTIKFETHSQMCFAEI